VTVDEDGCPIDSDGDGIVDYLDDCPREPGWTSLAGCPDKDGDGIADKYDDCPDDPGPKELKGCPDTDGDGVIDKNDECPGTPEGWKVDEVGCPFDNDGDGLYNEEDECPDVAGPKENNGCPIEEPEKPGPIVLDIKVKPVYFVVDESYLTDYSKDKLDSLIALLNEHPDYNVNLFGFTDDTASDEYNQALSERRVASVVEYLTSEGLDKSRISNTAALGETNPVADNSTEEGRRLNRRVEFEIFKLK
ncbi:MAG: OmpA family protein, partial [Halanaerobiales bacterium]|nr:OmpA family protein [Halanaerobiales bacterium]